MAKTNTPVNKMERSLKLRIMNALNVLRWTIYTPVYDFAVMNLSRQRKRSIELLNIQPGSKVLILGAGTGLDLKSIPGECEIYAIDITPLMMKILKMRAKKLGKKVNAEVMDAMNTRFPDESFDYIILHLILAVIPDPYKTMKEACRVLKSGGKIAVMDKFIPEGQKPGIARLLINSIARIFFTEINRSISKISENTALELQFDTPVAFFGLFRMIGFVKK